jgi:hypothetical protein
MRMSNDRGHGRRELAETLRDDLRRAEVESPSFERLVDYVEGRLSHEERAELEERLADDAVLRAEVDGLRELHLQMGGRAATSSPALRRPWILAGLAAAAAVAALALWLRPADVPVGGGSAGSQSPAPVAAFRDGELRLALAADGSVSGLPPIDPARRAAVAGALRGELPRPDDLAQLARGRRALMGKTAGPAAFAPQAPVGTRVATGRPSFRWTAHPDARAYEVAVFDQELRPQAASGPVSGTAWQPPQALPAGRVYLWQVTAQTARGRVSAPAPPAPEARFEVADAAVLAEVARGRAEAPGSHLVAALVLVEKGLLDEAEVELRALADENRDGPAAARLLLALDDLRKGPEPAP